MYIRMVGWYRREAMVTSHTASMAMNTAAVSAQARANSLHVKPWAFAGAV